MHGQSGLPGSLKKIVTRPFCRPGIFRRELNFVLEMHKATITAERTIAVVSPHYVGALYTQPEWAAAFRADPTGAHRRLIPVRIESCQLLGILGSIQYIDLVGLDKIAARKTLLAGIEGSLRGRSKPSISPSFPSSVGQPSPERSIFSTPPENSPSIGPREPRPTLGDIKTRLNQALMPSYNSGTSEFEQRLRRITGSLQQLLVDAVLDSQQGRPPSPELAREAADVLSQLTNVYPAAVALRLDLAKLRDTDYVEGLKDLEILVSNSAVPKSDDLIFAGTLLLNLGEYEKAKRLFHMVDGALIEQEPQRLWTPLDANQRFKQFITGRQLSSLWIPDYEGHYEEVFRKADELLQISSEFSRLDEAGVLHRLGRSKTVFGQRFANRKAMEEGADVLERARRLAGQEGNPYHDLWRYRAAEALRDPMSDYYWGRAVEASQGWGQALEAHHLLLEGRRNRMAGKPFLAIEHLKRAYGIWSEFPYPKGTCDVLCELGLVYASIGTSHQNQLIAARHFRIAEKIAEDRRLPALPMIRTWREICASRSSCTSNDLYASLRDQIESSPKLFRRYQFNVPGLTETRKL
jgi:tetratricopeptide (TPR) repeat protein